MHYGALHRRLNFPTVGRKDVQVHSTQRQSSAIHISIPGLPMMIVPIIIVYTQFDLFVAELSGLKGDQPKVDCSQKAAEKHFHEKYGQVFQTSTGQIPYTVVSSTFAFHIASSALTFSFKSRILIHCNSWSTWQCEVCMSRLWTHRMGLRTVRTVYLIGQFWVITYRPRWFGWATNCLRNGTACRYAWQDCRVSKVGSPTWDRALTWRIIIAE